jgi:hypothetical protein
MRTVRTGVVLISKVNETKMINLEPYFYLPQNIISS